MKSWKTTIAGVLVGAIALATYIGYLTPEQAGQVTAALTALGLILAKDGDVSGK
jgi:hypothetical protein